MQVFCRLFLGALGVLLVVAGSGCSTKEFVARTVRADKIVEYAQYPSGLTAFFRVGDTVSIEAKDRFTINSTQVDSVKMVIKEIGPAGLKGRIVSACCDTEADTKALEGQVVVIGPETIARVQVWDKRYVHHYPWVSATLIVLAGVALIVYAIEGCGLACLNPY